MTRICDRSPASCTSGTASVICLTRLQLALASQCCLLGKIKILLVSKSSHLGRPVGLASRKFALLVAVRVVEQQQLQGTAHLRQHQG